MYASSTIRSRPLSVFRAALPLAAVICGSLTLGLSASPIHAADHVSVKLDNLLCVEVTSGAGDDDAYLVAVGVNLKTGRTRSLSYGFPGIGDGERRTIHASQGFVFSDNVDDPRDILVLGAVLEMDHPAPLVGITAVGGENGNGKELAAHLGQEIDRLAKQYSGAVSAGAISRDVVKNALRQAFRSQVDQRKGKDDIIGQFALDSQNGGYGAGFWQQWLTGDGSKYQATFRRVASPGGNGNFNKVGNMLTVKKSKVRFRVRDAHSNRPLAARVQIIANGKFLDDRRIHGDGKYEFALLPGTYKARFTMKDQFVTHHTLVLEQFTVGASDYYKDISLKPVHIGQHVPGPAVDLTGAWQAELFGQVIRYQVKQTGTKFEWDAPQLQEKATGTVLGNNRVSAQLHGQFGNQPPIQGTVMTDAQGTATRIQWDNGVVFRRANGGGGGQFPGGQFPGGQFPGGPGNPGNGGAQQPGGGGAPGGYDFAGVWRGNVFGQSVRYDIQQSGGNFTWSAPELNETAAGEMNGKQLSVTVSGPFGSSQVTGTITKSNNGVAMEVTWNNGVRFVRDL